MLPDLTNLSGLEAWTKYMQGLVGYTGNPELIGKFNWDTASGLTVQDYLNLLDASESFLKGFNWSIITSQLPVLESLLLGQGLPAATVNLALGYLKQFAAGDISLISEGFDVIRAELAAYAPDTILVKAIAGEGLVGGGTDATNGPDVLDGTSGADTILGKGGADDISGGAGNDSIKGGAGNDTVDGGAGADVLNGDAGKDKLNGGAGNDMIEGDAGNDILRGAAGRDQFIFGKGDGKDRVVDFRDNVDTLVLDDALWRGDLSAKKVIEKFGEQVGDDFVLTFGKSSITLSGFEGDDLRNDLDIV